MEGTGEDGTTTFQVCGTHSSCDTEDHIALVKVIATANVDWRENDSAHIFRAYLPGVKKEDLKVQVEDGNILQISRGRSKEKEDKTDRWHRVERQCGSLVRRFRLPDNAELDGIKCGLENGVLTVTVPKKEEMWLSARRTLQMFQEIT